MEKTIGAVDVGHSIGRILQDVVSRGDRVVVERHGEPIAVVIPMDVYNQWKRLRSELFGRMREASERANLSAEEADDLAAEAVAAVRASQPA